MSLILDALNKAQQQQTPKDAVPNIGSYIEPKKTVVQQIPLWLLYVIPMLLLFIVIGLGVIIFRGIPSIKDSVASVNNELPVIAKGPELVEAPEFSEVRNGEHIPTQDEEPQVVLNAIEEAKNYQEANELVPQKNVQQDASALVNHAVDQKVAAVVPVLSKEVAEIYRKVGQNNAVNEAPVQNDVNTLYRENQAVKTDKKTNNQSILQDDKKLQDLWEQVQRETQLPEPAAPQDKYANLPYLYQLPESFQDRIPTLMYQNHIFSSKASAVVLNGESYRKGETLAPDLVIVEITENDLILSYLNKPFRLAALSSWVKMN